MLPQGVGSLVLYWFHYFSFHFRGWLKSARFFSRILIYSDRISRATICVPMGNPHSSVLVTKSAFTYYARQNIHSDGPRNKKCISSTSKCLSVWAKNILGSSLMMMAHDGHMGQTGYRNVHHGA
jgi:hypothetical protein